MRCCYVAARTPTPSVSNTGRTPLADGFVDHMAAILARLRDNVEDMEETTNAACTAQADKFVALHVHVHGCACSPLHILFNCSVLVILKTNKQNNKHRPTR